MRAYLRIFALAMLVTPNTALAASVCNIIDPERSTPLAATTSPNAGTCHAAKSHSKPVPDSSCTPGAINPTVSAEDLRTKGFTTTECMRNIATTDSKKEKTYVWYGLVKPKPNNGAKMVCELDHLIPLSLGGADTLENIWPQCGPKNVELVKRYFKQKDKVECYMRARVLKGASNAELKQMQKEIAADWTVSLAAAQKFWAANPTAKMCKGS